MSFSIPGDLEGNTGNQGNNRMSLNTPLLPQSTPHAPPPRNQSVPSYGRTVIETGNPYGLSSGPGTLPDKGKGKASGVPTGSASDLAEKLFKTITPTKNQMEVDPTTPIQPENPENPHDTGQYPLVRDRRRKVVKIENDTLKYEGEQFKTFLARYERTAEACGASEWDMVMQIEQFVVGDDLKLELESLDGYNERDWDLLVESMTEVWGDFYTRIKYTIQDLRDLSEGFSQKGGVKDIHKYKNFVSKFMMITKYLKTNEHITSQQDVVYIFLAAFSKETQKSIKRELIKGNKITYEKDGFCKPPGFKDLLDFAEMEMKADSEDTFGYGRAFAESNRVMQQALDIKKGSEQGKILREKMINENPSGSLAGKVDDIAKGLLTLNQKLENLPTNTNKEFSRESSGPQSRTLFESKAPICYYCSREGHTTTRCFALEQDEKLGLVRRIGREYYLPNGEKIPYDPSRPIRTVVAGASADPKMKQLSTQLASFGPATFPNNIPVSETKTILQKDKDVKNVVSSVGMVHWKDREAPTTGAENFITQLPLSSNGVQNRGGGFSGRKEPEILDKPIGSLEILTKQKDNTQMDIQSSPEDQPVFHSPLSFLRSTSHCNTYHSILYQPFLCAEYPAPLRTLSCLPI
ncbi:hypothetical protein Pst134EB_018231 [Puccinia striiformis f. sp. tritici]|nr:hypothetical protein Pst134EB_018231 [Puccinia striiformis f. sp. tritici]